MFKKIILVSLIGIILSFLFGDEATEVIASLFGSLLFSHYRSTSHPEPTSEKLFGKDELKLYNGLDKPELYLSLLGYVFDVSKGFKHYGPGQQYNIFIGCDASRSFVTGDFNKDDINDEVADLNRDELKSLQHWLNFYKKEYVEVGKLEGKYFDKHGKPTPYGILVQKLIKEAEIIEQNEDEEKQKFPPCNIEWDPEKGTRVWCSKNSGGISRNWIGVPRQLYEPGSKSYRCACISEHNEKLAKFKEYKDCHNSESCILKE
ncbi:neuferricin [Leptinotarsa decemlineata]|uniref:neuferricin n=1 Tax=Leptinotarsa decemlineata TaxID=7539 RepID=UPI003D303E3D